MIQAAILGCGTIGSGVYEVIERNQEQIQKKLGQELRITKILDIRSFPGEPFEELVTGRFQDIVEDPDIDIVVETMGGTSPAYEMVKACLLQGKHVVTSNKALVAAHGSELLEIAKEKKRNFFFEAAVGGGIPLIRTLGTGYAGQKISRITGILNGTTNYILTRMDREGADFNAVLADAQKLGYAERNPEADVEGYDTCRKISILTSIVCDAEVNYEDVHTEGITKISPADLSYAEALGASVKLTGCMEVQEDGVSVYVCPALVDKEDPLYAVSDVFNGVVVRGNMLDVTMLYGRGAGKLPTASAVLADMIEAGLHPAETLPYGWKGSSMTLLPFEESAHRYLVRIAGSVSDGLPAAEQAFGEVSTVTLPGEDEFAVLTGTMKEKDFRAAYDSLGNAVSFLRA